jgi:dienelactone hydrolase
MQTTPETHLPPRQPSQTPEANTPPNPQVMATLGPWLAKHREGVSEPLISSFVNTIRQIPGTNKVGAIGFCWGGRYAILQAHSPRPEGNVGGVDAAYACHPSLLSIPGDFEALGKPLSIAAGTKDSLLDQKSNEQIKAFLQDKKGDVPTEIRFYEDQVCFFLFLLGRVIA